MESPSDLVSNTRTAFASGTTKSLSFRRNQLKALSRLYEENTAAMIAALAEDLKKPKQESCLSETEYLKNDVAYMLENLDCWSTPQKAEKGLVNIMDQVLIYNEPYGVVLIIGAWNYPFQLVFAPLAGAIAAGNCAIIKPSELAPASAKLIAKLLPKYLDTACYKVVNGGVEETTALLEERFDYIFFTGSTHIGKIVHKAASKFVTPVTLEMGGKSPVYLDSSADIDIAANRIWWGKCINSGQSCIAPDYILCNKDVEKKFIEATRRVFDKWYSDKTMKQSSDYGRIINIAHFNRIIKLLEGAEIKYGGDVDTDERYIQPTLVTSASTNDPVMQQEIFGPILPILTVETANEAITHINNGEKPLALYVFSNHKQDVDLFLKNTSSGGVCINDTLMHFSCHGLPFGGVGSSGLGGYHGKFTFETFSHKKGVLIKDLSRFGEMLQNARYPPYSDSKTNFVCTMLKMRPKIYGEFLMRFLFFGFGIVAAIATKSLCRYLHENEDQ